MTFRDLAWDCFVALVYLATFGFTMALLIADWRLMFGRDRDPPWVIVFIISLLGPIGLCAAITVYSLDKVRKL